MTRFNVYLKALSRREGQKTILAKAMSYTAFEGVDVNIISTNEEMALIVLETTDVKFIRQYLDEDDDVIAYGSKG